MNNYEVVLHKLIAKLSALDFANVSARTDAEYDSKTDSLSLRYFGKDYIVTKSDCRLLDGALAKAIDAIAIVDYLLYFDGPKPGGSWIDYRDVPGSTAYDGAFRAQVDHLLGQNASEIVRRKGKLLRHYDGSVASEYSSSFDFAAVFKVLPRVECLVLLYEGDEEVGGGGKVLFSSNIRDHLAAETVAGIGGFLAERLVGPSPG